MQIQIHNEAIQIKGAFPDNYKIQISQQRHLSHQACRCNSQAEAPKVRFYLLSMKIRQFKVRK